MAPPERPESDVEAVMAAGRLDYVSRLRDKLADLERLAATEKWSELRRAAHKLRGSAGVFGFESLGVAAGRLEDRLAEAPLMLGPDERSEIDRALSGLRDEVDVALRTDA